MSTRQSAKLEVDLGPIELVGKEREHYLSLEKLRDVSLDRSRDIAGAIRGMRQAAKDWDTMLGGKPLLTQACETHIARIEVGDRASCRGLYLMASPMIFYIHALYQITRKGWRNAVIACGIYCERLVRNLALFLDLHLPSIEPPISELKSFADKSGRVKHDLESIGFTSADDLFHLLRRVYSARSNMGPHDVPPPEPLEAKINVTLCLPLYLDYLRALQQLGGPSSTDGRVFVSFMDQAARVHVQLAFGTEVEQKPANLIVRDRLYRSGFFSEDRNLRDVATKLRDEGYSFTDSVLANALKKLSTGKAAIITRSGKSGAYVYRERLPPTEYFRTLV